MGYDVIIPAGPVRKLLKYHGAGWVVPQRVAKNHATPDTALQRKHAQYERLPATRLIHRGQTTANTRDINFTHTCEVGEWCARVERLAVRPLEEVTRKC